MFRQNPNIKIRPFLRLAETNSNIKWQNNQTNLLELRCFWHWNIRILVIVSYFVLRISSFWTKTEVFVQKLTNHAPEGSIRIRQWNLLDGSIPSLPALQQEKIEKRYFDFVVLCICDEFPWHSLSIRHSYEYYLIIKLVCRAYPANSNKLEASWFLIFKIQVKTYET